MCIETPLTLNRQCRSSHMLGASLIELIMFIVIVGVALAGITLVLNTTNKNSADPLLRKQAMAAASSLLEEVELQDFISASGVTTAVTTANRATTYHIVSDYNGYATADIYPLGGLTPAAGLQSYNVSVAIIPTALGSIAAASAVMINVTVSTPSGEAITASGYRAAY